MDDFAILKAYPNVVSVSSKDGCKDKDGNAVSIDQTLVDAARIELNKLNYQRDRV